MKSLIRSADVKNPLERRIIEEPREPPPYVMSNQDRIVNHDSVNYLMLTPERTATRSLCVFLSDLNIIKRLPSNWIPNHNVIPHQYSGKVVVSVRHPLDRLLSGYFIARTRLDEITLSYMISCLGDTTKEIFPGFLWKETSIITNLLNGKTPDYVIRTESISSDLLQLPFIDDVSKLGHISEPATPEERIVLRNQVIMNREWAEKINTVFKPDFDNFGYETI